MSHGRARSLTWDGEPARSLTRDVMAYRAAGRSGDDHPAGARRVAYFWAVAPLVDEAPEADPTSAPAAAPVGGRR